MRMLTVYTHAYRQEVSDFFLRHAQNDGTMVIRGEGIHPQSGSYYMRCLYADFAVEAFTHLLEDIAVQHNPVYRRSAKLRAIAKKLRHTPLHDDNVAALAEYLHEHNKLHVEGYETFRMYDFKYRLDVMAYALVKQLRLT